MVSPRRALFSVSDKEGLVDFARGLHALGFELMGTEGTAKTLKDAGLPVTTVADYTGVHEGLGGRVKTLHPKIFAGILAPRGDERDLADLGAVPIDLVVVNLYPFETTAAKPDVRLEEAIETIDIGGVSLIRAAAKNAARVSVIVRPSQYPDVLRTLQEHRSIPEKLRNDLAMEVFEYTSRYDAAIYNSRAKRQGTVLPPALRLAYDKVADLRYGENPYQKAALYHEPFPFAATATAEKLQGKELSYNNLIDLDAALRLATEFERPAAVVIKHTTPSGVALASTLAERGPDARHPVRNPGEPLREIELDRARQGGANGRRRRGTDEPRRCVHARLLQSESRGPRECRGQRRVLPVPRRCRRARERRRRDGGSAGWLDPRRRGHRGGRRARDGNGLHGNPVVQTLRDRDGPHQGRSPRFGAGHGLPEPRGRSQARRPGRRPRDPRLQRARGAGTRSRESRERPLSRRGSSPVRQGPGRLRTGGRESPSGQTGRAGRLRGLHAPGLGVFHPRVPESDHQHPSVAPPGIPRSSRAAGCDRRRRQGLRLHDPFRRCIRGRGADHLAESRPGPRGRHRGGPRRPNPRAGAGLPAACGAALRGGPSERRRAACADRHPRNQDPADGLASWIATK